MQNLLQTNKPLAKILLKAQEEVFNARVGENTTQKKGFGYDFMQLREYQNGEDVKHIDWTISAKLNKPYVKLFHEQKELHIVIVPLLSASVCFGVKVIKQDVIAEICALLAFSSIQQNDTFSSYITNDRTLLCTQRDKSFYNVRTLVQTTLEYKTLQKGMNYKRLCKTLYTQESQKSLLFLVGDFFHTNSFNLTALALKHELIVIIVRDRFEEQPDTLGELHLTDPLSNKKSFIHLNTKTRTKIKRKVTQEDAVFIDKLKRAEVRFIKVYTDENPVSKILALMGDL